MPPTAAAQPATSEICSGSPKNHAEDSIPKIGTSVIYAAALPAPKVFTPSKSHAYANPVAPMTSHAKAVQPRASIAAIASNGNPSVHNATADSISAPMNEVAAVTVNASIPRKTARPIKV